MDKNINFSELVDSAERILIGIGERADLKEQDYTLLKSILGDKDYFIVSIEDNTLILNSGLNCDRITCPQADLGDSNRWEEYMQWLSRTLNHNLLIIELGVSLSSPGIIRFPFEKTCFYNNKAKMIRVNTSIYQIPEEISDKGIGIKSLCSEFLLELFNDCQYAKID